MTLSPEDITKLLKIAATPKRGGGGRSGSGKKIDTSIRTEVVWFALAHKLFDEESEGLMKCANPDCVDPRPKDRGTITAQVEGQFMCRYCFLAGWLTTNKAQLAIESRGDD